MYPTRTDNIVAYAKGPAGPAGPINQSDIDALKGEVPADGDTLRKLYDLIAEKAPIDGAGLTNATTTTQAGGNDSAALATTAFVHSEVANAAASVSSATDSKLTGYAKSADVATALSGKLDKAAVDTDSAFAANSDGKVPSQKAVKSALDLITADWTAYTPIVTSITGTITSYTASGGFKKVGKTVFFRQLITLTSIGTAAGAIVATLPSNNNPDMTAYGKWNNTAKSLSVDISGGSTYSRLYDGSFPFADGSALLVTGFYREA